MKRNACGWLAVLLGLMLTGSGAAPAAVPTTADRRMNDGLQAFQQGAFEQAVLSWTEAATLYEEEAKPAQRREALLHLAEAYQALGQYGPALQALETARKLLGGRADREGRARLLASLGALYVHVGQEADAERYLKEGLELARDLNHSGLTAALLNNRGNLLVVQQQYAEAVRAYEEAALLGHKAGDPELRTHAQLNGVNAIILTKQYASARERLTLVTADIHSLEPSHVQANALMTAGLLYQRLAAALPTEKDALLQQAIGTYETAGAVAEKIGDGRAASYAWGHLGGVYESQNRLDVALEATRHAVFWGQKAVAPEALYRWHWQVARLMKASGEKSDAMAAYRRALAALQSIRPELATAPGRSSASFRETVGKLYFELADLLLQQAASEEKPEQAVVHLKEARDVVELFKVGELRDYFRDDCVDAARARATGLEVVSKSAAIIYPIPLANRTELLVSFTDRIERFAVAVTEAQLTTEVRAFRKYLEKRTTHEYLPHAQRLYDWLLRPLESSLVRSSIDTLVFVPDGALRTIPMAALHDGKQFLIGKYAIATTPGLTLTDPRPLRREGTKALSGGLTQAVQGFPPLPNVSQELQNVNQLLGGTVLLNQDFKVRRVEHELKEEPFTVVHLASHGLFESDAHKSFILAFDDKLTMDRLTQFVGLFRFRDEPLGLLTLSACETAAGDDRAALGLAGVAIKAGARSALATLWFINDEASSGLVSEFYRHLQGGAQTKAMALQGAQRKMLKDPVFYHPAYWAPFLLLNNWL